MLVILHFSGSTSRSSNCKWGTLRESSTHSKVKDTDASYRSLEPMASGHAKELWTKDQYPLVRPEEATSTSMYLSDVRKKISFVRQTRCDKKSKQIASNSPGGL